MDPIRIELPFEVLPKQTKLNRLMRSRRTGKLYMGRMTPKEVKANRDRIVSYALQHRPDIPFAGPVQLDATFCYPAEPGGEHSCIVDVFPMLDGWRSTEPLFQPKTTPPDSDNLAKQLLDALERAGFFKNDAQVADLRVRRFVRAETH